MAWVREISKFARERGGIKISTLSAGTHIAVINKLEKVVAHQSQAIIRLAGQ